MAVMKEIHILRLFFIVFILLLSVSCNNQLNIANTNVSEKYSIKGKVYFPDFSTKSTITEIAPNATVSLLNPSSHPDNPNKTIATGLTDINGNFTINPSVTFQPSTQDIYIIEASKRVIEGVGADILGIRTYVKWNGSEWDSITYPGIYLNTKTTAMSVLDSLNESILPEDTIGTMDSSSGTTVPGNIGTVTAQTILEVAELVTQVLAEEREPVASITSSNQKYFIERNINIGEIKRTGSCINCNFQGIELNNIPLQNIDLSGANLRFQDFTAFDLTGTVFMGSILSNTNFEGQELDTQVMNNADISHSYMASVSITDTNLSGSTGIYAYLADSEILNTNFSNSDYSNADFRNSVLDGSNFENAVLRGANFEGASIQSVIFTGADLTGSKWIDGSTCGENSIGSCQN